MTQKTSSLPDDLAARLVALELLVTVMDKHTLYSVATSAHSGFAQLDARDRQFVQLLVFTVLRHAATLDALIARFQNKPFAERYGVASHILRLGAAQLVYLDTPAHAAVHSSVSLTEHKRLGPVKGVVNAVLRRVSENAESGEKLTEDSFIPDWMQAVWRDAYGDETAAHMSQACMREAPLDITVNTQSAHAADHWAEWLDGTVLNNATIRLAQHGPVPDLAGFSEGAWWVQDVAAAIPAQLLGDIKGKRVLDLCAAPGGKTLQLAAAGATVTAVDKSVSRLRQLHENLQRMKLSAEVVESDVMKYAPAEKFDIVLLDAPCSATGTLRRHPDIAYTKAPEDVHALAAIQLRMLDKALDFIVPGGQLLYCICSLQPEESERQVEAFIQRQKSRVALQPLSAEILGESFQHVISPEGYLRTLPSMLGDQGDMDGFFAACFRVLP